MCVFFTCDILLDNMLQYFLIFLIFRTHEVSIVQVMRRICLRARPVYVIVLLIELSFNLRIYVCVAAAVVHKELLDSHKFIVHRLVRGAGTNGSGNECADDARPR